MPAITISLRSVQFNKACHEKLDNCEWVEMLYHPVIHAVVIRKSFPDNTNSFRWIRDNGQPVSYVETKAFSESVYNALKWIRDYKFRFRGITKERGGGKVIMFSLEEPQILTGNSKRTLDGGHSPAQYIPYTTDAAGPKEKQEGIAYPQEWMRRQGLNALIRRKRDESMAAITEEDIYRPGVASDNPLIGEIPDRDAILKELDELLLSM